LRRRHAYKDSYKVIATMPAILEWSRSFTPTQLPKVAQRFVIERCGEMREHLFIEVVGGDSHHKLPLYSATSISAILAYMWLRGY
jgi:hypothetical protein